MAIMINYYSTSYELGMKIYDLALDPYSARFYNLAVVQRTLLYKCKNERNNISY